jgi:hypothetical protein
MKQEFRERKQAIRNFMQAHYTDERLAMLLAHAQEGKLLFASCCCFIGVATADHTLSTISNSELFEAMYGDSYPAYERNPLPFQRIVRHYDKTAKSLPGALEAEMAYMKLGGDGLDDAVRRRILIPMIKAEMKRRAQLPTSLASEVGEEKEEVSLT